MALSPVTGRCAFGCSTFNPSINQRYCCGVNCRSSRSFRGHWYTPRSRRLYRRMKPSCSQYRPLIRSRRRPQKRKSVLVKGSSSNSCCTIAERPSIPFLRSVYPQAMNTRSAPLKSFTPPFQCPCGFKSNNCRSKIRSARSSRTSVTASGNTATHIAFS